VGAKARARHLLRRTLGVLALLGAVWFLVFQPLGQAPAAPAAVTTPTTSGPATVSHSAAPRPNPNPSSSQGATHSLGARASTKPSTPAAKQQSSCRAGQPARLVIPALGVNAAFERIGLDQNAPADAAGKRPLGNPVDRRDAGWYQHGPQPGSGRGTVLVNGHTYRNGSAIFKEDFANRVREGQRIDIVQSNGSTCSYRVDRIWGEVDSKSEYPQIVAREGLYDFDGPERLFLATCGGRWSDQIQNYLDINIVVATPIDR
jgi:hypothetical protein